MSELPFELYEYHKRKCRQYWEKRGMIFVDDEHYDYVYNEYIHATNCDLCNKQFLKSQDRCLDHDHTTGEIRNVVCQRCNIRRKDNKPLNTNTGQRYISKIKHKGSKTGYCFQLKIERDGKRIIDTSRNTLEKAIKCRDDFITAHPEIYS
tara:strand:- start:123 stop:572 length:450 start_codon:yes stop_codon:yes gene_type:complete